MLSHLSVGDPIAAPVTPAGRSAIAGIRLSGDGVITLVESLGNKSLKARHATRMVLTGIDDIVAIAYPAPASYTGEEVVELFTHGNPLIVQMIIDTLKAEGVRLALPGEFTFRAVVNGKMDLLQAEGIEMMISAQDPSALLTSHATLSGALSSEFDGVRSDLLDCLTQVESAVEFPEEGFSVDRDDLTERITGIGDRVGAILETARRVEGDTALTVVLAGPANTGKSTLFNALVGWERAIVHAEEGTTRDIVGERVTIEGVPLHLMDTAGLRSPGGAVEEEGIRRTRSMVDNADAVLFVVDGERWSPPLEAAWREISAERKVLVWNKADLGAPPDDFPEGGIALSALKGENIHLLHRVFLEWVQQRAHAWRSCRLALNERQEKALTDLYVHLKKAAGLAGKGAGEEEIAFSLAGGGKALAGLMGEIGADEIFDAVFSRFCVGK